MSDGLVTKTKTWCTLLKWFDKNNKCTKCQSCDLEQTMGFYLVPKLSIILWFKLGKFSNKRKDPNLTLTYQIKV